MSEMVERLAWKMARSFAHVVSIDECRFVTRQLLEELREPTEAMNEACRTSTDDHVGGLVAWGIMIDAALGKETA